MSQDLFPGRRRFLIGATAATAALLARLPAARAREQRARFSVRVASNQGAENSTIQQLLRDRGFARSLSLDVQLVEGRTISAPMEALLAGDADICRISGFTGILPAIEQGKELRLVGAAMLLPALAVYSTRDDIRRVQDLAGRTVGVGGTNGLLHILMLALLRKKGVDATQVRFVNAGSNAQVLDAAASRPTRTSTGIFQGRTRKPPTSTPGAAPPAKPARPRARPSGTSSAGTSPTHCRSACHRSGSRTCRNSTWRWDCNRRCCPSTRSWTCLRRAAHAGCSRSVPAVNRGAPRGAPRTQRGLQSLARMPTVK